MIELANKATPAKPQPLAPQDPDNAVTGEASPPPTTDTPPPTPGTTPPRPA
ncbi:hypothetical protein H010_21226 [Hydrogenophaga taeniospiralis CCUG 15921]|uniref:Uncharacterized protein n=1 Tax=Hydrogenophaga taeniospiralis CCUG 15921 TaxID=1281780 RepID=A0A9X4NV08_9BURK|nr:hypothetical protein [Hydrogenophaga taeniospiralis]MDG5977787.1 hypothetical protein [Hydrogenophaga taeniospiralis CCUG 15921]